MDNIQILRGSRWKSRVSTGVLGCSDSKPAPSSGTYDSVSTYRRNGPNLLGTVWNGSLTCRMTRCETIGASEADSSSTYRFASRRVLCGRLLGPMLGSLPPPLWATGSLAGLGVGSGIGSNAGKGSGTWDAAHARVAESLEI